MTRPVAPGSPPEGGGDPWAAFGYLVAGVGVYGLLGWLLGRWLHASYLTPVGIVLGAVLGLVLVFYQVGRAPKGPPGKDVEKSTPPTLAPDERGDTE